MFEKQTFTSISYFIIKGSNRFRKGYNAMDDIV
jgi:hypothetical protein